MTRCEQCHGEGHYESHTPGNEGVPERDDEVVCSECCGTGSLEAAQALTTLCALRDAHALARHQGQPGLGGALWDRVYRALGMYGYSQLRYAEMRNRLPVASR